MPTDYSPSGNRRSSRRGGSRRTRGGRSSRSETASAPVKKPKSLIEKIIGFFQPKTSSKAAPAPRTKSAESTELPRPREKSPRAPRSEEAGGGRPTGFRKPELVEVTSSRIYVGNLSFDAVESDLFELFNGVGLVKNVEVVTNRHTMKSKGFAFVEMQTVDEAKRAVTELHDKEYMGRKLVVSGAKAVEERRSERSRQPEQ